MDLRHVRITRFIMPLREGGSLPGLVEADDDLKYVIKFKGNGHGTRALVAEYLGGQVARALGLRVPELVFATLDADIGRTEGDEEVQDLLRSSTGLNIGLHFLAGAITFDPVVDRVDGDLASRIVWLDAVLTNIDRTVKNTNMLMWNKALWLIDHGSSFYFHHAWHDPDAHARSPFPYIKDHVLLPWADRLAEVDAELRARLTPAILQNIIGGIPEAWLAWDGAPAPPDVLRATYLQFLTTRLAHSAAFIRQAQDVRPAGV